MAALEIAGEISASLFVPGYRSDTSLGLFIQQITHQTALE